MLENCEAVLDQIKGFQDIENVKLKPELRIICLRHYEQIQKAKRLLTREKQKYRYVRTMYEIPELKGWEKIQNVIECNECFKVILQCMHILEGDSEQFMSNEAAVECLEENIRYLQHRYATDIF